MVKDVYLLYPNQFVEYAPLLAPHIERVLKKSGEDKNFDTIDVLRSIAQQTAYAWLVMEGTRIDTVVITQVMQTAKKRFLLLWLLEGTLESCDHNLLSKMEAWAYHNFGCTSTETVARPGLAKFLKKELGFDNREIRCTRKIPYADT